jgi:hypothetical protein
VTYPQTKAIRECKGGEAGDARVGLMDSARVIDGHVDLPIFVREAYGNNINKVELEKQVSIFPHIATFFYQKI